MTYNQLLDAITEQMQQRLTKRADQFSNKDLLDYAKVVSDGIDKAHKQINNIDTTPMIQINQQNNVIVQPNDELDRESRERIIAAAKAAMQFLQQTDCTPVDSVDDTYSLSQDDVQQDDTIIDNNCDNDENDEKFDIHNLYDDEQDGKFEINQ